MNMKHTNIPTSFEECKTVEQAVAFCLANGYDKEEAYEMVEQAFHNPMSNDIYISSPVYPCTSRKRFDWFSS